MYTGKIHVPPIKIQGIKTKLVSTIMDNVYIDDNTVWIEPFMGSGVVGFNISPKNAIFADTNPHIISFYQQLQDKGFDSFTVAAYLEKEGRLLAEKDEAHYYYVRNRFNTEHSPLDFLFLNRSCFNGMIRFNKSNEFNVPYGHKPKRFSRAYITKIVNQIKYLEQEFQYNNWQFVCQSYEKTIKMADSNSFIYCDPPYIGRHVDYYDSWDETQELSLRDCLLASQAKFMLSTWDYNKYRKNHYIDDIWHMCNKINKEHFYFVGAKEDNRNSIMEALLTNYEMNGKTNSTTESCEQLCLLFEA